MRKFLVTVSVSIRPIGGEPKYGAVGYDDEAAVDADDIEACAHGLADRLAHKYRNTYANTILAPGNLRREGK